MVYAEILGEIAGRRLIMGFYGTENWCGAPGMFGFGGPFIMGLLLLALIALIVVLIYRKKNIFVGKSSLNASDILKERLAKGEISIEEFRILRDELD